MSESKQLEHFQETSEETNKILSEEHDKVRESNEKDTITKLKDIQEKLNYCNMELEKKFKQTLPDYKVSY